MWNSCWPLQVPVTSGNEDEEDDDGGKDIDEEDDEEDDDQVDFGRAFLEPP